MIVGICNRELGLVAVFSNAEVDEARAWCYMRKTREIYEISWRGARNCRPEVARQHARTHGRLLTTGRNAPHQHTSAELREQREHERRVLRSREASV